MTLQVLVAAVGQKPRELAAQMHISSDAIIINQDDHFEYEEFSAGAGQVRAYSLVERGVGLSRNTGLLRATADIILFSDDDIVLQDDYADTIIEEFAAHPKADIIIFNVQVDERRRTYENKDYRRIRWHNYGRYPTYGIAARRGRLHETRVTFSLLFGGGAPYSSGEDSIFLHDCLKKGLKLYASPRYIGSETYRQSTWFSGYSEKFFHDRGVAYRQLYGRLAKPFALRFLWTKRAEMCQEISVRSAYKLMKSGIMNEQAVV